ncbi:hypothetical protein [Klebsiella quasipneumoniae]|uniref:hypothetical protein n=1 Tax=Klebsiella quasipneumoniae TaxID=1463165 RepID=UPI001BA673D7|nr:hypothetical protein [Klebsiella quasipneumoniae]QUN59948.1 hypothetical protein KEF26_00685 [Klebsiella quasipneumoniae]
MAGRFFCTKTRPGSTNFQEGDGHHFVVNVLRVVNDIEPISRARRNEPPLEVQDHQSQRRVIALSIEPASRDASFSGTDDLTP